METPSSASAGALKGQELTEEEFLANYDASRWPHPALTADIAVFRCVEGRWQLLMVQRGGHPYRGCWALPGGFFEPGERIEQTAVRELEEEAGIFGVPLELFGIYSAPGRDPRDWVVTAAFLTVVGEEIQPQAGDDALRACWFDAQATCGQDGSTVLLLTREDVVLSTRFTIAERAVTGMRKARVLEQDGFAFDHGEIVADAWANVSSGTPN